MKHLSLLLLWGAALPLLSAQTPMLSWAKALYGATPNAAATAEISDLAVDPAGNMYIAGEFHTQLNFGNGVSLSGNGTDAAFFLAKFSPAGTALWAQKVVQDQPSAGSNFNGSAKIAADAEGNVYWGGNYKAAKLNFNDGFSATRTCTNDCVEGFLAKVNASGTVQFVKALRAGNGQTFSLEGLGAAADGQHYIAGRFFGTELFLQGGANVGGITQDGFFTAKYKANGAAEWVAFLNDGSSQPIPRTLEISPDGQRIVVAGTYSTGTIDFGNGASTTSTSPNKRFFVWYNTIGQAMGAGTLGCSSSVDIQCIQVDAQYRVWAAFDYLGNLRWNETAVGTNGTGNGNLVLATLQAGGAATLTGKIEHSGNAYPVTSFATLSNGRFFTLGNFDNTVNVPVQGAFTSQGCFDLLLTSGTGQNFDWAFRTGQSGCEESGGIGYNSVMAADANNNLYLCGRFSNGGTIAGNNFNGNGLWIARFSTGISSTDPGATDAASLELNPNPARDHTLLRFANSRSGRSVRVFNSLGRLVLETPAADTELELNTAAWPPGLYIVSVAETETGMAVVKKLVVE